MSEHPTAQLAGQVQRGEGHAGTAVHARTRTIRHLPDAWRRQLFIVYRLHLLTCLFLPTLRPKLPPRGGYTGNPSADGPAWDNNAISAETRRTAA